MPMEPSIRSQQVEESATLAVSAKAAGMKSKGIDVVSFGAGEPDFDTPQHIKQAAKDALDAGQTKYAKPTHGIAELKKAICAKFSRDNGLKYQPSQVIVTVGGKEALYLAFQAVLNPADEVIIPVPYWVSYPEQVKLSGGVPIYVEGKRENEYKLTPQQIVDAITPRTKVLVFNSPSNPGGFTYTPAQIKAIAKALAGRPIWVFSDEMYDQLVYGGLEFMSFAAAGSEWYEKTITFNAGSKTYSMTGWRIGYAAGPQPIIKAMANIQSQTTSGTGTFTQVALASGLEADQSCVQTMRQEFERRADHMHKRLNALAGVTCAKPTGAFYCFPDFSGSYGKLGVKGSVEFCSRVLEQVHVAMVPGIAFGSDANARLSFATSMAQIDKGLDRLEKLLGRA
jgi:aspartate aminotransferase